MLGDMDWLEGWLDSWGLGIDVAELLPPLSGDVHTRQELKNWRIGELKEGGGDINHIPHL